MQPSTTCTSGKGHISKRVKLERRRGERPSARPTSPATWWGLLGWTGAPTSSPSPSGLFSHSEAGFTIHFTDVSRPRSPRLALPVSNCHVRSSEIYLENTRSLSIREKFQTNLVLFPTLTGRTRVWLTQSVARKSRTEACRRGLARRRADPVLQPGRRRRRRHRVARSGIRQSDPGRLRAVGLAGRRYLCPRTRCGQPHTPCPARPCSSPSHPFSSPSESGESFGL